MYLATVGQNTIFCHSYVTVIIITIIIIYIKNEGLMLCTMELIFFEQGVKSQKAKILKPHGHPKYNTEG